MFYEASITHLVADICIVHQCFEQQPASIFASGIQKLVDVQDKCLNEFGRYVEK